MKYKHEQIGLLIKFIGIIVVTFVTLMVLFSIMKNNEVMDDEITGFTGVLFGGLFTLTSNWYIHEYRDLKEKYNNLPQKIRMISRLRKEIYGMKMLVSNNREDLQNERERILDIAAQIDGETFAQVDKIDAILLQFNHRLTESLVDGSWGPQVDESKTEYIEMKQMVLKALESQYDKLLKTEETLTRMYE